MRHGWNNLETGRGKMMEGRGGGRTGKEEKGGERRGKEGSKRVMSFQALRHFMVRRFSEGGSEDDCST